MILHSVRIKFLDMDILVEFVVEWNEVYECDMYSGLFVLS